MTRLPTRRIVVAGLALAAVDQRAAAAREVPVLSFAGLYGPATAAGIQLTPAAQQLVGSRVRIGGFMAPPLKAESDFFVLTRYPMSICPFCSNAADWPVDIVLVRLDRSAETIEPSYAIEVTGILRHGMEVDAETGFASLVRVVDATWRRS